MEKPQFLKKEDITDFKRDTCIFCNEKFKVACTCSSGTAESTGDHGFGGGEYAWWSMVYSPRELELYIFSPSFIPEEHGRVYGSKPWLEEKLTREIKARAEHMKKSLQTKIDLPEAQKKRAIDALVNDCLAELEPEPRGFFSGRSETRLDMRIERYFHNLFLGDLEIISAAREDYGEKGWEDRIHYTHGLKAHTKCWLYKKVGEGEEVRAVHYRKFLEHLQANPRFANYQACIEEFPEIFDLTKKLSVQLKVHKFDPFTGS